MKVRVLIILREKISGGFFVLDRPGSLSNLSGQAMFSVVDKHFDVYWDMIFKCSATGEAGAGINEKDESAS